MGHYELKSQVVKRTDKVSNDIGSGAKDIEGDFVGKNSALRAVERLNVSIGTMGVSAELVIEDFHIDQILFGPLNLSHN